MYTVMYFLFVITVIFILIFSLNLVKNQNKNNDFFYSMIHNALIIKQKILTFEIIFNFKLKIKIECQ